MILVALTLGLFGSLHCLGMCGPIAIGFQRFVPDHKSHLLLKALTYNFGRIFTYTILGLILGLIGQVFWISGMQKFVSIFAGILFVVLFFMSLDFEQFLFKIPRIKTLMASYNNFLSKSFSKKMYRKGFLLGLINGLIPCGLVYIALAGALLEDSIYSSILFMFIFGMGTLPMMFMVVLGGGVLKQNSRKIFRKITPYLQLAMGVWFLYRGFMIDYPLDIDFYLSLKEGPFCH